jgi:hypothetical protein
LSPAKLSSALQEDFVRTELETGHRMLALAGEQENLHEDDAARQSLNMAHIALSGAERHLAAVNLAATETAVLSQDLAELRRRIEAFQGGIRKPRRQR